MTSAEPETRSHWVLHVDLDQFIAAVEVLRHPELAGLPVVVGGRGDPTERAVVATASYEARAFGVHSGMPLKLAIRKCPEAVFLPHDRQVYEEASASVMDVLGRLPVVLETIGWDEAFLEAHTSDPETLARQAQRDVLEETGLHCSIGIGDNTLRAKIATGFGKPRGLFRLTAENWFSLMGERPIVDLWGIGTKTARKLNAVGLNTVADLARADPRELAATFGPTMGPAWVGVGRGLGRTHMRSEPWVAKSRSHETTYQQNLTDPQEIRAEIAKLAGLVVTDIAGDGRLIGRVGLKVRYAPFFTRSTAGKLPEPTLDAEVLARAAVNLLPRIEEQRGVRLLGVRLEFAE